MKSFNLKTKRGAAMLIFVLFFAFATSAMMFILGRSIFSDLADFNRLVDSKRGFLASESLTEDVIYRRVLGFSLDDEESLVLDGITVYSTSTLDVASDTYFINTLAQAGQVIRKSFAELSVAAGSSFNYGLQAGNGGINLDNGSRVIGNVYSNGPITGANRSDILGDVVSAGSNGLVRDVHATGSVYAHRIDDMETDVAAYYNVDLNPTGPKASDIPAGERHTPAVNQPTTTFPFSTTTIQEWKDSISTTILATDPPCSGGTYVMDDPVILGNVRIECDVEIKDQGSPATTVTLTGPIWITGDLSFSQGPTVNADPSLGRRSVQMMVDGTITLNNSTEFNGSGDSRSYVMLMSFNVGTSTVAIDLAQSADGDIIAYAEYGLVEIGNHVDLKEITAYQIDLGQNTDVVYEQGLASLLFTGGPGGGYIIEDWQQAE